MKEAASWRSFGFENLFGRSDCDDGTDPVAAVPLDAGPSPTKTDPRLFAFYAPQAFSSGTGEGVYHWLILLAL